MKNNMASLVKRSRTIRRRLQILKEQAAVYPIGNVPVHLQIQVEETEKELDEIENEIETLENKKIFKEGHHQIKALRDEVKKQKIITRRLKERVAGVREVNKTITASFVVLISIIAAVIINFATVNALYTIYAFMATMTFCGFTFGVITRVVVDRGGKITIERRSKQN